MAGIPDHLDIGRSCLHPRMACDLQGSVRHLRICEETLERFDAERGCHGFGAMPYLPHRAPLQRLIAEREEFRPAAVLALRTR